MLLGYCAAAEHFAFLDNRGVQIYLADGKELTDVGVDKEMVESGEYDEAWYARGAVTVSFELSSRLCGR